jgi:ribonuclease P protein component
VEIFEHIKKSQGDCPTFPKQEGETELRINRKFRKKERLCSRKTIEDLFKSGKVLKQFPFKLVYSLCPYNQSPVKIAISVPKKIYKRAVKRNFIRRKIREVYRLNKHVLYEATGEKFTVNIIVIYVSPNIASYAEIEKKFIRILYALVKDIKDNTDICPCDSD